MGHRLSLVDLGLSSTREDCQALPVFPVLCKNKPTAVPLAVANFSLHSLSLKSYCNPQGKAQAPLVPAFSGRSALLLLRQGFPSQPFLDYASWTKARVKCKTKAGGLPQTLPSPSSLRSLLSSQHARRASGLRFPQSSFVLPGDSWLLGYYQQGPLTRRLRLITKSLISWRKLVLEQYPQEKCSGHPLLGNRLRTVAKFGAIWSEPGQLKRDVEGWQQVWAQHLLKRAFLSSFQDF